MDPLSVIASVAGIATAAGEVIKILRPYTTAAKDAPVIAAEVSSEALATQTIIIGLEQLISNFSAANVRYASLIQGDQLTAVLFDGVKIFSELLAVLQTLPPLEPSSPGGSLWTPIQWVRKKSSLTTMLHKLRAFKSSIVCILSILQSDSLARAEESQQQLIAAVDMLLRDNSDLSRRMMGMENIVDTMSHRRATIQSTKDIDAQKGKATSSQRSSLFEFDFEHDLKLSRVYRHAKRDTMDFSARSSVARTHAWSSLSGISLSDISHISVLALPLYVEDISNPQHYNFGQESIQPIPLLAPTTLTRSIYHDCIEVQLQLSQLSWFSQFHQRESSQDENPLSNLISIFRLGIPLLMLFDQLDSSNHERWEHLIASNPSGEVSKLAITEFLKACMKCPTISPSQLVTDTDILLDDTTCHVKVISLVRLLLASLTKAGMIQAIVFESAPNIFAVEPNPASLAVDAFLCDERLYLKRLEILFETVKEIRSFRNLPIDSFDSMFAPIGPLINVQTKFLIKAEILASKPYSQQSWQLPFQEWALHSSTYYATLITGQAETKSMIRAALSLADVRDVERRGALGDFLTILGLPSQQLDKYDAFLKEITQYGFHQPDHIDSAKRSLNLVKEAVNKASITQELNHARAALSKDQDYETNKALWGLGKLLMYDKVDIVDARQEDARQEKVHLYLFQKGIVQAVESFPRDRRRGILGYGKPSPPERLRTRLSVTRIIPAKNLQQVHQVLKLYTRASNVCEIKWIGDETCGCISFAFGSETRITEWIRQVKRVKRQNQLLVPFGNFRGNSKYPLVLLGAGGCGTSDLTIKFVTAESCQEFDPSKYDPYCRMCVIDDGFASIDVIDATGQEDYSAMRQQFIREGAGFMLVYNVTSRRSFEEITTYYHQILKQKDEDHFPVVIVGIDRFQESLREVMTREGESLAEELGCTFVEVDAKSSDEVDGAFFDLVREVRWYRRDLRGY